MDSSNETDFFLLGGLRMDLPGGGAMDDPRRDRLGGVAGESSEVSKAYDVGETACTSSCCRGGEVVVIPAAFGGATSF